MLSIPPVVVNKIPYNKKVYEEGDAVASYFGIDKNDDDFKDVAKEYKELSNAFRQCSGFVLKKEAILYHKEEILYTGDKIVALV